MAMKSVLDTLFARVEAAPDFDTLNVDAPQDLFIGTPGDDTIYGTTTADVIRGLGGDDLLFGDAGNDLIKGGLGDDILGGGAGEDILNGGGGDDIADYSSDPGGVSVNLSAGTAIDGFGKIDTLFSIENVWGSTFGDSLFGDSGDNVFYGVGGDDWFRGFGGDDMFFSGAVGDTVMDGGLGWDIANYSLFGSGLFMDFRGGLNTVFKSGGTDVLENMEGIIGSGFGDTFAGGDGFDRVDGGGGNDFLIGEGRSDELFGNTGSDLVFGGAGIDDVFGGDGADTVGGGGLLDGTTYYFAPDDGLADRISGNAGNDIVWAGVNDTAGGGAGFDWLMFSFLGATSGVNVDLDVADPFAALEAAANASLNNFESLGAFLFGSSFDDTIVGNAANAFIFGDDGDDSLTSSSTSITLDGGEGNDVLDGSSSTGLADLYGGAGDDTLIGGSGLNFFQPFNPSGGLSGPGDDTIIADDAGYNVLGFLPTVDDGGPFAEDVSINLRDSGPQDTGVGTWTITGRIDDMFTGDGDDVLVGNEADNFIDAGGGNNDVSGHDGDDVLLGGDKGSALSGGSGDDFILGGAGDDDILGGQDDDFMIVGGGRNTVNGGEGDFDTAAFDGTLADFQIKVLADGSIKVTHLTDQSVGGKTFVTNTEYLAFYDTTVDVSTLLVAGAQGVADFAQAGWADALDRLGDIQDRYLDAAAYRDAQPDAFVHIGEDAPQDAQPDAPAVFDFDLSDWALFG